ncbi:alpha/beta hydrolase [Chroococcidiopsis sp. FACHB-1243]|uniref:alpha/beta hydrolase n=1 Tax=Chroococcidiopsis sp. [FACHB-1243] TaxID=2692781 RepID=UPI00177B981A|nr:alpha/beta hydrolase [Chroococcidiopsis sp. [FACHB-1243]]MBD2306032.1 alpha/beta hydrolase [Chroococcidiopsis sp. [FACHB-1243]]
MTAQAQNSAARNRSYVVQKIKFNSQGVELVGCLFAPEDLQGKKAPAIPILGPVAFVKEQSPLQYATRLASEGFITLIFDPRTHGESGGEPRRYESGKAKVQDIRAAIDFLATQETVNSNRIFALGVCQGVNWIIEAATQDQRIKALSIVAGHYLILETAEKYLGSTDKVQERIARATRAREKFERTRQVDYIPIVSEDDPNALLLPKPIYQWYVRWADRGEVWRFHGLWENRIAAMSEAELWGYRVDETVRNLNTPILMIHSDRAASSADIPKQLFKGIPAKDKELVWLGNQVQFQFYEDPVTIDRSVHTIAGWFRDRA